jgi:glutamine synthetase
MSAHSDSLREFLAQHRIHEVECVIPDMTGIARGDRKSVV